MTITRSGMTPEAIEELISQRVTEALAAQEANRNAGLVVEGQSQNGDDDDNRNVGNGNHGNNNGDGNRNGGNGGARRNALVAKACTYKRSKLEYKFQDKEYSEDIFSSGSALEDFICVVFVPDRNIELTLLCSRMVPVENKKIEKFIWGQPDNIQVCVYATRSAEQKRKFDNNPWGNRMQQPPFKRQDVAQAFMIGNNEKRRAPMANKRFVTSFGCGGQEHYKSDCLKLKNHNRRNKAVNNDACRRAYALGGGDGNPDSNVVTGTFLLKNCYEYILFDYSIDRSFISTMFSSLIDITPTVLDVSYIVELADG
ncbi:hypothetical protein Tco_0298745 [Tanacetum coccineum]